MIRNKIRKSERPNVEDDGIEHPLRVKNPTSEYRNTKQIQMINSKKAEQAPARSAPRGLCATRASRIGNSRRGGYTTDKATETQTPCFNHWNFCHLDLFRISIF